jgi:hypothetical protein
VTDAKPGSLMDRLSRVRDPRRREGKRYKLPGLLGMLTLAAVHGERSLRGMWLWRCARWEQIAWVLDLWDTEGPPSYGALWNLMAAIDAEGLGEALCAEGSAEAAISVDGKVLRGSKRATQPALQVITAAGHRYRAVLAQRDVAGQDMMEAAVALLHEIALDGKLVSLDAGLLQRSVVKTIVEKRGPTWGRSRAIMANSTPP